MGITVELFKAFRGSAAFELLIETLDVSRPLYDILMLHGSLVANKALQAAEKIQIPREKFHFIYEASMLHDIGIIFTNAPSIDCFGKAPYLQHGLLGAKLLNSKGLPLHARVCECHIGVGLTKEDIEKAGLPLPQKDFIPKTQEEKLISWADKYFSKTPGNLLREKSQEEVLGEIREINPEKVSVFMEWEKTFNP